jgi:hypothetical protein
MRSASADAEEHERALLDAFDTFGHVSGTEAASE